MFFQEKKEEDWTDEERRAAVEYQKKVKELEEEREKFRKVALLRFAFNTSNNSERSSLNVTYNLSTSRSCDVVSIKAHSITVFTV